MLSSADIIHARRAQLTDALHKGESRLRELREQVAALSGQLQVFKGCLDEYDLMEKRMAAASEPVIDLTTKPKKDT